MKSCPAKLSIKMACAFSSMSLLTTTDTLLLSLPYEIIRMGDVLKQVDDFDFHVFLFLVELADDMDDGNVFFHTDGSELGQLVFHLVESLGTQFHGHGDIDTGRGNEVYGGL